MTDIAAAATGALAMGVLVTVAFRSGLCLKPTRKLDNIEQQVTRLRCDFVDYRVTHEHDADLLARRLDALEATTAQAANEVRMASDQLLARIPPDAASGNDRRDDHA